MASRKSNHEGSVSYIKSRKDTKPWRVRLMRDGLEYSKYFATKKEAEAYRVKLATRDVPLKKRDTAKAFRIFCDEVWLPYKRNELKPRSYETTAAICERHVYRYLGMMGMNQIGNKDVQDMVFSLAAEGYSKSTVLKARNAAVACLRYAAANNMIDSFPIVEIVMPNEERYPNLIEKEKQWFTEDEMNRYVAECYRTYSNGKPKHPNGPMYALVLHTGIREGEAFALEWSDYNRKAYTLTVDKNAVDITDDNGKWHMVVQHTPKTKAGNRTIKLSRQAVMDLEALLKLTGDKQRIMSTNRSTIMSPSSFTQGHHRICKAAGLPVTGVHSLRHSYVTYRYYKGLEALKKGGHFDPRDLAAEIGHANLRTMYEIYTHLSLKDSFHEERAFEDLPDF